MYVVNFIAQAIVLSIHKFNTTIQYLSHNPNPLDNACRLCAPGCRTQR